MSNPQIHALFDTATNTLSYAVWDPVTLDAVVIDTVVDFDPATQMTSIQNIKKVEKFVADMGLKVHWVLETHAHADHFSAGRELKKRWPAARWAMGSAMTEVFTNFSKVFKWPGNVKLENLGVDRWLSDGEEFTAGSLRIQAISTPGHTPACMTFKIGENLFTGDALMMPDGGTGRCDFPGGSASKLYDSVWGKLYAYPDHFKVWVGHDYQPGGRPLRWQSTIADEKANNIHLKASTSKQDFVTFRETRDKTLSPPRLLDPSLDWNLGAHQLITRD